MWYNLQYYSVLFVTLHSSKMLSYLFINHWFVANKDVRCTSPCEHNISAYRNPAGWQPKLITDKYISQSSKERLKDESHASKDNCCSLQFKYYQETPTGRGFILTRGHDYDRWAYTKITSWQWYIQYAHSLMQAGWAKNAWAARAAFGNLENITAPLAGQSNRADLPSCSPNHPPPQNKKPHKPWWKKKKIVQHPHFIFQPRKENLRWLPWLDTSLIGKPWLIRLLLVQFARKKILPLKVPALSCASTIFFKNAFRCFSIKRWSFVIVHLQKPPRQTS